MSTGTTVGDIGLESLCGQVYTHSSASEIPQYSHAVIPIYKVGTYPELVGVWNILYFVLEDCLVSSYSHLLSACWLLGKHHPGAASQDGQGTFIARVQEKGSV